MTSVFAAGIANLARSQVTAPYWHVKLDTGDLSLNKFGSVQNTAEQNQDLGSNRARNHKTKV